MEENFTEVVAKRNFELSEEAQGFLKETAKWAYFLSIIGFVGVGFMVLLAFFMGTIFSVLSSSFGTGMNPMMGFGAGFTILYLLIAVLYFFPIYYLFQFSSKLKKAFKFNDNEEITASFEFLKSHYKFMGILALIFVCFYGFVILMGLIVGIFSAF